MLRSGILLLCVFLSHVIFANEPKTTSAYALIQSTDAFIPIDLSTGTPDTSLNLECAPDIISLAENVGIAYICEENKLIPFDLNKKTYLNSIRLEQKPKHLTVDAEGKIAYCLYEDACTIHTIDLTTGKTEPLLSVKTPISGLHVKEHILYATQNSSILPIDLNAKQTRPPLNLNKTPQAIAIHKNIFSIEKDISTHLNVYSSEAGDLLHSMPLDDNFNELCCDGNTLYLYQKEGSSITVLDATSLRAKTQIETARPIQHLALYTKSSTTKITPKSPKHEKKYKVAPHKAEASKAALLLSGPKATSTTISSSANPGVFGASITFSSTVTSLVDAGIPTGTVTFVDTILGTIGTGTLNGAGVATFTTSSLNVGTYSLSANYGGDVDYSPSSSSPPQFSQQINQALTTTSVVGSPAPSLFGNPVTFTATVSVVSPGAGTPTGTVTFYDGATSIGTGSLSGNTAVLITSSLSVGTHSITAVYAGDSHFVTSTSPVFSQTVNKGTTSTTVGTSLTPSPFGNSVTFTATISVTGGVGTPTGTVSFKDGATTIGTVALSGGTATLATSSLSVGTHSITAVYNGDTNFATSTSSPLSQVISQGTTSTALISSVNPSTYGQSVTFTATVSVTTGAGTPTGTVTFKDGATTLGSSTVGVGGVATFAIFSLSVSTHSITAVYNGDTNFSTSTSSAVSQVVGKATPIITLASSLNPSNFGDTVIFTSTVSAPTTLGLPSGTISFYNGVTLMGTATLVPTGANTATATFSISNLNAGTWPITAQYSGDGNFFGITSSIVSQVVNPVTSTQIKVFSNSRNPSDYGEGIVLRATVSGSTAFPPLPPSGTVTFYDGASPIGTVTITPVIGTPNASSATLPYTFFAIGNHSITAQYSGDVNYPPSPVSSPMVQQVVQASTTSVLVGSGNPSIYGQTVTYTITVNAVSPGGGTPTGTVAFYDNGTFLGNSSALVPGVNSSTATFAISTLSPGTHKILAIYPGDTNFTTSSSNKIKQIVNKTPTTTTITTSSSSPPGFTFGSCVTFTATVAANSPGSGTPTGTVQFFDGATLLGTANLSGGTVNFSTRRLYPTPPTHSITAVYSGDVNFFTSTSPIFPQNISGTLGTAVTITSSRNASPGGASVTYTATVVATPPVSSCTGIVGIPTGTVTFTDTTSSLVIGTATLNANGVATIVESGANLPFVPPAPDIHVIQATYNGQSGVFNPSTSAPFNQYVVPFDTTTLLVATPNPSTQGGATLTATVSVVGGGPPAHPGTGTVTFYAGTLNLGTVPVDINGVATLNPNNLTFGTDQIVAVYSGDTLQFAASTSNTISLQVQQTDMLTTAATLTQSSATSVSCENVTFTVTVVATQGFYIPTGSVTFFDNDVSIDSVILDATGKAQLTVSSLTAGVHTIRATYNSDSNYAFSFSNTLTHTVNPNTTTLTFTLLPNLPSVPYGENLVFSAMLTSGNGTIPTGTVTFSYGDTVLTTVDVDNTGKAVYEISTLNAGTYTFDATYTPTACFQTASASRNLTITRIDAVTSLVSTPNPSIYGDELTLYATITSPYGEPTGTVTFYNQLTNIGTRILADGSASIELESPLAGFTILGASYSGDTNFLPMRTDSVLQTIDQAPTSTCLVSYTENPSVYGEIVLLHADVFSTVSDINPGITGTVVFKNGSTVLGTVPVSGCQSAELETASLNLGSSNNITATYSGDNNFITSTSNILNKTVNQAATLPTVTSITSSPNPPTFGTLVTFNVTVAPTFPGSGIPTGTISGYYGTTLIGTASLVNGSASFSTSTLPAGVDTIIVKYNGDTNFSASQTTATETVLVATTTTTLSSSSNPAVYGAPVTFSTTVSSTQGTPTGTVSFLDGTTTLATETLNSSGSASFTISNLSIGTHSIRVVYSGSANLGTSTSSTLSQVINKANTTTTLQSTANPSYYGQAYTLTATVSPNSPGSGLPTGTITFKNGAATIGTASVNAYGQAILPLTTALPANASPYSLTAVYSGDTNFNTSTGALSQTVKQANSNINVTYSPNPAAFGQQVTLNVTVGPVDNGVGLPTGTVTAMYGSQVVGSGTLSASGTVSFLTTSLPAGTLGIVVKYLGDANFLPSTIPLTESVNSAVSTTTLTSSTNPALFGQPITFSVSVTSAAGTPTGTVTFFDGTNILGTQALNTLGQTTLTTTNLSVGSHTITATYNGDNTNATSTSAVLNQVVNKENTTTLLQSSANPAYYGQATILTATVSSNVPTAGIPTGTVTFKNGVTTLGTGSINAYGQATLQITTALAANVSPYSLTAIYSGDTNFNTSTGALSQTIKQANTDLSVTYSPNPATYGQQLTINATVVPVDNGTGIPTGTVTAMYGSQVLGSGALSPSGTVSFLTSSLPAGNLGIVVKYVGDSNFLSSTIPLTEGVSKAISTTTITPSTNPASFGQPVTFSVSVTSPAGTPTGVVTFFDGTNILGTQALNTLGQTTFTTTNLSIGTHTITATYDGDSTNATSTSTVLSEVINQAPTTTTILSSALNPSTFGQDVNFFANVTSSGGIPTGTVTFFDGVTPLSTVPLYDGFAILSISSLAPGAHNITAVYNGSPSFAASTASPIYLQQVNPVTSFVNTVTSISSNLNPANYGDPVTFTIAVTSPITPPTYPTGFITLFSGSIPLVTLSLDPTAHATYTTSMLPVGNLEIVAFYSGDSQFSASNAIISQVVNPITTTTTLTSSSNPETFGTPVTFTATVSSSGPQPTGSVSFYEGASLLQTVLLNMSGIAEFTSSSLDPGAHNIIAIYNPDPNFETSQDTLTQTIIPSPTTTTILSSSSNPSTLGTSVTFFSTTSAPNGTPNGTVTFYDGATPIGSSPLFGGIALFSTSSLSSGPHNITAAYGGSSDYDPSTSSIFEQDVINFDAQLLTARNFCVCQVKSEFLNANYRANVLTWLPPGSGATPTSYQIYRDANLTDLIATIPGCGPFTYTDPKCKKGKCYTYYLVCLNDQGVSPAISVTLDPRRGSTCCHSKDPE